MILSSFLTGVGGTFYAFYLFSLQPNAVFGIPLSVEIIIRPIVGGAGTLLGPDPRLVHPDAARRAVARSTSRQGGWHGAHLIVYGGAADRRGAVPARGRVPAAPARLAAALGPGRRR